MHPIIRLKKLVIYLLHWLLIWQKNTKQGFILSIFQLEKNWNFNNNQPLINKKITAECCIHHLWFNDSKYLDKKSLIKWNPAVKSENDRKALIEAINENIIDVIATDHAPHTFEEKNNSYLSAPSGGPLVQHALLTLLELEKTNQIKLKQIHKED